jgi:hypothetical protein
MRVLAAVIGIGLALAGGWWFVRSRDARPNGHDTRRPLTRPTTATDAAPLAAPLSKDERERLDYARVRAPFLARLREMCSADGAGATTGDDLSELSFAIESDSPDHVARLRDAALGLRAADFGFRVMRFYVRDRASAGVPPRLVAEVALGEDGRWRTFLR